ncbi:MAG: ComEC/Rec2 family competence protein [Patescibacteria group bacterium]
MGFFRRFETPAAFTGVLLVACIFGIAVHSAFRYANLSPMEWLIVWPCVIGLVLLPIPKRVRLILVIGIACLFGFWRFDVAPRPKLRWIDGVPSEIRAPLTGEPFVTFSVWRDVVTQRIASAMPRDEATLVASMLYGDDNLSKSQKDAFELAGLMHIVAVSGSNVTFFIGFVLLILHALRLRRRTIFAIASCAIIAFVCFVGPTASILRAGFVGWLVLLAYEFGFLVRRGRLLLCAAVIILLIDPWQLGFDAGFAITFLALWGLLEWTPIFEHAFKWLPQRFGIRRLFAATSSATLMTIPYTIWAFHQLTLAGLLTNIFAWPLVPFVMGWGAVAAIWGNLPGAPFIAGPAYGLACAVEKIANLASLVPWLESNHVSMDFPMLLATYLLIVALWWKLRKPQKLSTEAKVALENPVSFLSTVREG